MKKISYFSLRLKIAVFILIGTLIFSAIILYITHHYVYRTLTDSLIEQGHIVATNISELAAEKIIEEDIISLKTIIEKNKYNSNIEYILIEDFSGTILTDTYNANIPSAIITGHSETEFNDERNYGIKLISGQNPGTEIYDIKQPIKEGLLGFVRVGMKKSFVDDKIGETIIYLSLVFLIGTFLAITLTIFIITLQFSRPIAHLTDMAYKISMGDFNKPVRVQVKNEIGILAEAIERMRESLKSSIERLKNR
ncbi:MAG: HAMP domain-containing protein [Calditrichaeota bacterium]|nr:HAMP domain-containing protein [Calditrichota bacterium]RQV98794.1 MAG: HAMP domain-containing protein [Calditrichota bacterium]